MNEHQMLIYICNIVDYKIEFEIDDDGYIYRNYNDPVDVREIIFTQEFIDRFWKYGFNKSNGQENQDFYMMELYDNLNDPVKYLYNRIKQILK